MQTDFSPAALTLSPAVAAPVAPGTPVAPGSPVGARRGADVEAAHAHDELCGNPQWGVLPPRSCRRPAVTTPGA